MARGGGKGVNFVSEARHNSATIRKISMVLGMIIEQVSAQVTCKNDNSDSLHFLIITLIHIFNSFPEHNSVTLQPSEIF